MLFLSISASAICEEPFIDWDNLPNPQYSHEGWSTKDACMVYHNDTFYIFFSAFYWDDGRERSHVTGVKTKDFRTFSDPLFLWHGRDEGWIGVCSPNITKVGDTFYLTYNSWGDKRGKFNQLFYATSKDLENWEHKKPLARNVTKGFRAIDAAMAYEGGKYYVTWKQRVFGKDCFRMACADSMEGPFEYAGHGYARFLMPSGVENGLIHENFEFIKIDGRWHVLVTDYRPEPHAPYIYRMEGSGMEPEDWLKWVDGRKIDIAMEPFNTEHQANASFLADWRDKDGFFYLLYAGRTEDRSHAGRGDNKLGLSRSTDLINWFIPGK
jgi:hypothetical protein